MRRRQVKSYQSVARPADHSFMALICNMLSNGDANDAKRSGEKITLARCEPVGYMHVPQHIEGHAIDMHPLL